MTGDPTPHGESRPAGDAPEGAFVSGPLTTRDAALFTDLYEVTMAASYFRERMHGAATFSLFVRKLPKGRAFLVAAGLEDVLAFLQGFRFSPEAIDYLGSLGRFDERFLAFLRGVRFTGDVRAVPEGTVVFADEPLLEVTAPILEAQLVETAVINFCHFQTVLASKAVRSVLAARGRPVVEFGLRRTPGVDAGMKAARSAFIAGATMSSNVLAGRVYGIPPTGTMAHSYVAAFREEIDAFRAFARAFPDGTTLLIDTYDTVAAAHKAVEVARELAARGHRLAAVRLDSGDILALSREVRRVLDQAGLDYVRIFVSGGLDEYAIDDLLRQGAPVDAFGVGTRMDVSADAPYLDMAYKLVRYDGRNVLKISAGKETWTGEKQVYRVRRPDGRFDHDVLALRDEPPVSPASEALLDPVMRAGALLAPHPPLAAIRGHCAAQLAALPDELRALDGVASHPVHKSERLLALQRALRAEVETHEVRRVGSPSPSPAGEPEMNPMPNEVSMDLTARLNELARISRAPSPVVSVYLNTRWADEHHRDRVRLFLKNELRRARRATAGGAAAADLDWIETQGAGLIEQAQWPEAHGVALFACEALGLRDVLPVRVAFEDAFVVADAPHLRPLAELAEETPPALIVFVDAESARLIPLTAQGTGDEVALESEVPGHHKRGGWAQLAQSRYQRHIQVHRDQHFEATVQSLIRLTEHNGVARIVLAGETRNRAIFRDHLPPRVAERVAGGITAARYEPASALIARASALLAEQEEAAERAAVDHVLTEAAKSRRAVAGLEEALEAVSRGAVHRLYLLRNLREQGRACRECGALQRGAEPRCRVCGKETQPVELGEAMVDRVVATGGTVEALETHAGLARVGGVAGLLRYEL